MSEVVEVFNQFDSCRRCGLRAPDIDEPGRRAIGRAIRRGDYRPGHVS